ncbi:MFS transporter [Rhizodiscina lignyota]|uniref:MFS transporter n=1 Tax=Rhizodiscina lignyota TaxID=1504668 RepID=A0A9P4IPE5_9PEZI|nr:MFS transporter [Rhizodiscina lignyota]
MGAFNRGYATSLRGFWLQGCVTLCAAFAFTLFGYDQGVLGGLIALPVFLEENHIDPNNTNLQGTIVAIYDIGCLIGCISMGFVGQKFGRRIFIAVGGVLLCVGAGCQAGSHGTAYLIGGRVVGGIGMGITSTIVPIWVAEMAKANFRGALVATQLTIVILGVTIAYWTDYGMIHNHPNTTAVWRFPIAFQTVYIILTWAMIFFLPESPRYLYAMGHTADADDVMARIYSVSPDSAVVANHRQDVFTAIEAEKEQKFGIKNLFYDDSSIRTTWRLWLCFLVQFFQQMDGNNIVSYYATYLFINSCGMSQDTASITSGGVTLVFLGGTATTIWTIERWGRRPVMFWGAVLCSLWMILFTIGLAVNTPSSNKLAVASIFLFEFFFGASWCSAPWVYVPEIAPLQYRHIGASMGIFGQWIITFIVVKFGPMGIANIHWKFYLLFCVFNVLAAIFVWFAVKETKGLSLEEIDLLFAKDDYKHVLEAKLRGRGSYEMKGEKEMVETVDASDVKV